MKGFKNANIYVENKGVIKTNLVVDSGKISYLGDEINSDGIELDDDMIVVPGFIDQHIHGANGSDAMDASVEALQTIASSVPSEGTTTFLATTMTQSPEKITKALNAVKEYKSKKREGAEIAGVHLEGPFISIKHVGAQPLEYVQAPLVDTFKKYNEASENNIKIVTMAPEVEGADELIKYLDKNEIVPSIGHTDATYNQVVEAVNLGAKDITHTYNAQKPLHHREIGVVGSALLMDELNCEMICDCIHVSIPAMKLVVKNKPYNKLTLITDAMRAKNLPDGISELGGQTVYVKGGEARLKDGTLAGSVLRMNVAIKNVVTKVGVPFEKVIDYATINPATTLKINDKVGSIKVGKQADFAVLDKDFNVIMTIKNGEIIYKKN